MKQQKTVKEMETGGLFLVATPIGNMSDITYRAVEVLKEVSYILAEDTRVSKKLLDHYQIDTPLISCHEHNQFERLSEVVADINAGQKIALVSDAGMPCISDPGSVLVEGLIEAGLPFTVIPGASAGISSYVLSGMSQEGRFTFHGFLPTKTSAKIKELSAYLTSSVPVIFYESPHRIEKTLLTMKTIFPSSSRFSITREYTKLHETITWGTLQDVDENTVKTMDTWKGEIVLILWPQIVETTLSDADIIDEIAQLVETGMHPKTAIKEIATKANQNKREVYKLWEDAKKQ